MEQEDPGIPIEDVMPEEGYTFEDEINGPTPRATPPSFAQGRLARSRRLTVIITGTIGAGFLLMSFMPWTPTLAHYLLPMKFASYIGIGLITIAGIRLGLGLSSGKELNVFRTGEPFAARIVDLAHAPIQQANGSATLFAYFARVVFTHPRTNEAVAATIQSRSLTVLANSAHTLNLRVGETVTGLFDRPNDTAHLYAFLDLKPDVGIVLKKSKRASDLQVLLFVVLGFAAFAAFVTLLVLGDRTSPLQISAAQVAWPAAIGAAGIGSPLLLFAWWSERSAARKRQRENESALAEGGVLQHTDEPFFSKRSPKWRAVQLFAVVGGLGLSAVMGVFASYIANAALDSSTLTEREAALIDAKMTTRYLMFRTYTIEIAWFDNQKRETHGTSPTELNALTSPHLIVETGQGRFGWPYIRRIRSMEP